LCGGALSENITVRCLALAEQREKCQIYAAAGNFHLPLFRHLNDYVSAMMS
jgi:hypothetical protein